ncbi:hypothetical protein GE061_007074 [Apolygus lucorum]|uniref:Uncharacterized protein n=1 Tax=Apolygus lucorum TaxID=248454 RepID=A0A8S9WS74_APOLU|nr:hypothetical protein GE061_007074 [Apolygus lucorum]
MVSSIKLQVVLLVSLGLIVDVHLFNLASFGILDKVPGGARALGEGAAEIKAPSALVETVAKPEKTYFRSVVEIVDSLISMLPDNSLFNILKLKWDKLKAVIQLIENVVQSQ